MQGDRTLRFAPGQRFGVHSSGQKRCTEMASTPPCVPLQRKRSWSPVLAPSRQLAIKRPTCLENQKLEPRRSDAITSDILARNLESAQQYEPGDTESDMPASKRKATKKKQEANTPLSAFRVVKNRKTVHQEPAIETLKISSGKTKALEALKKK